MRVVVSRKPRPSVRFAKAVVHPTPRVVAQRRLRERGRTDKFALAKVTRDHCLCSELAPTGGTGPSGQTARHVLSPAERRTAWGHHIFLLQEK